MAIGPYGDAETCGLGMDCAVGDLNHSVAPQGTKSVVDGCIVAGHANQRLFRRGGETCGAGIFPAAHVSVESVIERSLHVVRRNCCGRRRQGNPAELWIDRGWPSSSWQIRPTAVVSCEVADLNRGREHAIDIQRQAVANPVVNCRQPTQNVLNVLAQDVAPQLVWYIHWLRRSSDIRSLRNRVIE